MKPTSTDPAAMHTWAEVLDLRLSEVVPAGADVALFDYPFYLNPGDAAIAAGELAWLARNASRVICMTRRETLQTGFWPEVPEGAVVLFQGGGNIGDLYPEHRVLLEKLLGRYPDHDVVMLPQSVNFRDPGEAADLAVSVAEHRGRVTMMWRDTRSLETARRLVPAAHHVLSPDAAAGFAGWQRLAAPVTTVTHVLRRDEESSLPAPGDVPSGDWPYSRSDKVVWQAMRWSHRLLDMWPARTDDRRRGLYQCLSAMSLRNALGLLSTGEVVVTDRLHGHILSTLMGVPNVLLGDSYGKVRNYYETWSRTIPYTAFATSPDAVPGLIREVRELVGSVDPGSGAQ